MPQFDQVSFISQVFWISVLFLTFYFLVKGTFLPKLAASVKARAKLLRFLENPLMTERSDTLYINHSGFLRKIHSQFEGHLTKTNDLLENYMILCRSASLLSASSFPLGFQHRQDINLCTQPNRLNHQKLHEKKGGNKKNKS